jgi:hypothetical protein
MAQFPGLNTHIYPNNNNKNNNNNGSNGNSYHQQQFPSQMTSQHQPNQHHQAEMYVC